MGSPRGNTRKYGKLWGGRDATYSLALGSLNAEDSHVLNFTLKDLEYKHQRSLRLYEKHFHGKYPVVGRLTEYTNQTADLPSLEELPAKNEPRPSPPTMQRRIKKLTAVTSKRILSSLGNLFKIYINSICVFFSTEFGVFFVTIAPLCVVVSFLVNSDPFRH
eukprot:GEMP01081035.1.p1 GENE.GEMP01081035.1~~GEMP01081035.1.p1  ORF type:complete len:162 (+),score=14.54 GEMP01081035.1:295-780(+)